MDQKVRHLVDEQGVESWYGGELARDLYDGTRFAKASSTWHTSPYIISNGHCEGLLFYCSTSSWVALYCGEYPRVVIHAFNQDIWSSVRSVSKVAMIVIA